uniref:ABSCISIC ACID-INSENSITIVE 5-like protein 2 n=1 Tax=Anthurium amnicola TaxID=1678845 RepID=A0A1D1XUN6_9ARAE
MGIQTMASQGGGEGQHAQFQTLGRQGSLYGLTLNEVQNQLGEPLHCMNLDELLRSILPAEGDPPLVVDLDDQPSHLPGFGSRLHRQGSVTLTRTLSKKTVDEVWRDIQGCQGKGGDECRLAQERRLTLGEMTLEDFLVRAGVVVEAPEKRRNGNVGSAGSCDPLVGAQGYPQGVHWVQQYHQAPSLQQQPLVSQQHQSQQQQQMRQNVMGVYAPSRPVAQPLGVGVGSMLDSGYSDGQLTMSSPIMGALSDTQTPGGKRVASGEIAEKTVERRQKRMIKNRESAARSRARKQAYTNELENKVSRLEEENERLKKQKEMEKILYAIPPPEPKFRLRRTSSAPF